MTETFRILKNEPFESLKYYQLVSTLVANHQDIEKITVIKNKKTDTFNFSIDCLLCCSECFRCFGLIKAVTDICNQ